MSLTLSLAPKPLETVEVKGVRSLVTCPWCALSMALSLALCVGERHPVPSLKTHGLTELI